MYTADTSAAVLEFVTNKQCLKLLIGLVQCKLSYNNPDKTQALVLGHSNYEFALRIDNASVSVSEHLKILRVTLDKKLAFTYFSLQLEKGLQNDSSTEKITSLSPIRNYEKALQGISSTVRLL